LRFLISRRYHQIPKVLGATAGGGARLRPSPDDGKADHRRQVVSCDQGDIGLSFNIPGGRPHVNTVDCSTGVIETATGQKLDSQAAQAVYQITVMEENAKIDDLRGTIIYNSSIVSKIGDLA
jgi:hypothetical protein